MMSEIKSLKISTKGEGLIEITSQIKDLVKLEWGTLSGVLTLFNSHTSCGLTISESYSPEARVDLENFLKHLAPRNLKFITHTDEGDDDSPSHMKSILMQTSLQILIEKGELILGQWQGIYLCEFRDSAKTRTLLLRLAS